MARQYHDRALLLMRQERLGQALEELQEGLRELPGDPYLHALLAICHSDLGRHEEALREAREAVGLSPDYAYAHYAHAVVLLGMDRAAEAEAAIREAIRLSPDYPPYHAQMAFTWIRCGRWAEALDAADRGLAVDPDHADCARYRATALRELGRTDEAVETLRRSLSRDPEDSGMHAAMGWTLLRCGEGARALEHFREGLRLEPRSESARTGLLEALRARHPLLDSFQQTVLALARIPTWLAWVMLYAGAVAWAAISSEPHPSERALTFVFGVVVFFAVCILFSWTADPLLDVLLLVDRAGRRLLTRAQRTGAALMGGAYLLAAGGWVAVVAAVFTARPTYGYELDPLSVAVPVAVSATGLLIPLGATLSAPAGAARRALGALTALLYGCAAALVAAALAGAVSWYVGLGVVIGGGILLSMAAAKLLARPGKG